MIDISIIEKLPKVELHIHLEGSIRPATLLKLAQRNEVALPAQDLEGLTNWYEFQDFPHFVEIYTTLSGCIRTVEDIELIATEFAETQRRLNILYTEVTYTPLTIRELAGISLSDQIAALDRAFTRAKEVFEVDIRLILDIVRGTPFDAAEELVQVCIDHQPRVVSLGLSGIEGKYPVSTYRPLFERAKAAGLGVTSHAGETGSAEIIKEALAESFADRIGHGIRCFDDPFLVKRLRDEQIHIEVNPSSNICLKVSESWEVHPLGRMLDEGLNISINTDDPPMFGTDLNQELALASQTWDLDLDILYTLTKNAVNAAFLSPDEKGILRERIIAGYSEIEAGQDSEETS